MAVSYKRLWIKLAEKEMSRADLRKKAVEEIKKEIADSDKNKQNEVDKSVKDDVKNIQNSSDVVANTCQR